MPYGIKKNDFNLDKIQNIIDAVKSLDAAGDSDGVKTILNKLADEIKDVS